MKLLLSCLMVVAFAAAQRDVQILRYDNNNDGLGNYKFAFEQSDGTKHEQQGQLKNAGRPDEALVVTGQYSWVGPDGVTYTVKYVADQNGYQPTFQQGPGGAIPARVIATLG